MYLFSFYPHDNLVRQIWLSKSDVQSHPTGIKPSLTLDTRQLCQNKP